MVDLLRAAEYSPAPSVADTYQLFVSYAHEDREPFVVALVHKLRWLSLRVWFADTELQVGDSIRRGIDRGLSKSSFGVVILSPAYLKKQWTQYELDGLVARETVECKVILPIWHGVRREDVLVASPSLAQRISLDSSALPLETIAFQIAQAVASR